MNVRRLKDFFLLLASRGKDLLDFVLQLIIGDVCGFDVLSQY
jgi:hypothetical protein